MKQREARNLKRREAGFRNKAGRYNNKFAAAANERGMGSEGYDFMADTAEGGRWLDIGAKNHKNAQRMHDKRVSASRKSYDFFKTTDFFFDGQKPEKIKGLAGKRDTYTVDNYVYDIAKAQRKGE